MDFNNIKNYFIKGLGKARSLFIFQKDNVATSRRFPSLKQWRQLPNVFSKKEKRGFFALLGLIIFSSFFIILNFYFNNTIVAPSPGGVYREAIIGQPRFINPLYLSTQDVDRDLVEILFSGLMKYDNNGDLAKDLAESYAIKDEGKSYEIYLKENLFWHDKKPITADDIIFTAGLIQNPQYQSPLRIKWSGIVLEKITNSAVRFKLSKKYSGFLENLTLKILPKHIFENIPAQDMPLGLLAPQYLVGSGPFKYEKITQDRDGHVKEIIFKRNKLYHGQKPLLETVEFIFIEDEKELLRKAGLGEIQGLSINDPDYLRKAGKRFHAYSLSMPRYFAFFFNLRNKGIIADKMTRQALALAVNKRKILNDIFYGKGSEVNSPVLPAFFNFKQASTTYDYSPQKAAEILDNIGFKLNPATQKREKAIAAKAKPPLMRNLKFKDEGADVRFLQECLSRDKEVYPAGEINGYFGEKTKAAVVRFQEKYKDEILKPADLARGNGEVKPLTREKLLALCYKTPSQQKEGLNIVLTTCDKFPLNQMAEAIKNEWEALGIGVEIQKVSLADFQNNILSKSNFEIILFGEALGILPDPFPFWHSSQKDYPGLNISGYESKEADKLLEKARDSQDKQELKENLEKFQETINKDLPAVFLTRPDYIYLLSPRIKGFNTVKITEPAKRFSSIEQWYINTKRTWR